MSSPDNARGHAHAEIPAQLARLDRIWSGLIRQRRFARAWRISDRAQRLRASIDCRAWPRHTQFIWNGAPLAGRRVLIRCYHGLGDTIQYARFVPLLREIAADTVLWAQPRLIPLLRTIRNIGTVVPLHEGSPEFDYDADIELAELMHFFRVTPETLPAQVPYLHVPRVPKSGSRLQVGVVWEAGSWDPRRSVPCRLLEPIARVPGVDIHVFQHGAARAEWRASSRPVRFCPSLPDEARALCQLDVLVCVDTFAAHLAGALAVPVWLLLHSDPDWRWMLHRDTTPWYPHARLFRQQRPGDWRGVMARVYAELQRFAAIARNRCRAENPASSQRKSYMLDSKPCPVLSTRTCATNASEVR